ncbi:MAG TPA: hypothetical protein VJ953_14865 [Saprospiraceae bacterium]|nr:hypothetical protein [Saprospiraceae bacterium]
MKKLFALLVFNLIFTGLTVSYAQTTADNIWKSLAKITFEKQYDEMLGFKVDVPVFSEQVKGMEGEIVEIKGYIIPVEGYKNHKEFIFSAFPYNMCFFCGGAGPETVMEVYAAEAIKYTAEPIIIRGKLELNDSDINRLIYGLQDATFVKEAQ